MSSVSFQTPEPSQRRPYIPHLPGKFSEIPRHRLRKIPEHKNTELPN